MGWQDRDWAKLDDDELRALYGVERRRPSSSGVDHGREGEPPAPMPNAGHTRLVVWGGLAVLAAAVFGFGYTQRPHGQSGVVEQPRAVFGTPTRELGAEGPDGLCTELIWDGTRRVWTCENIYVSGMPMGRAAPYDGPCTHLVVDQELHRWSCLSISGG